jgi:hypothetical protein
MKTLVSSILIVVFSLSSIFVNASEPENININNVEEDKVINSTKDQKSITTPINAIYTFESFMVEEEMFIEDIPFDTEKVVNEMNNEEIQVEIQNDKLFMLDDEGYIDDIPFNTSLISQEVMRK